MRGAGKLIKYARVWFSWLHWPHWADQHVDSPLTNRHLVFSHARTPNLACWSEIIGINWTYNFLASGLISKIEDKGSLGFNHWSGGPGLDEGDREQLVIDPDSSKQLTTSTDPTQEWTATWYPCQKVISNERRVTKNRGRMDLDFFQPSTTHPIVITQG